MNEIQNKKQTFRQVKYISMMALLLVAWLLPTPPVMAQSTFELVKDINPGTPWSQPLDLTVVGTDVFFSATDGVSGRELWKSDGTLAGTVMVKDILTGSVSSGPNNLVNMNGTLFFFVWDGISTNELWKSDGTTAGTVLVKASLGATGHSILTNVNGTLYFSANDGVNGTELWKSDGTTAGTVMAFNINPASNSSSPKNLTDVNGTLFFSAGTAVEKTELWKSVGGAVSMVKDINPGGLASSPGNLTNVNGTLFFSATDGTNGAELWKSDGTLAGTVMVKDINPGGLGSSPHNMVNFNGTLVFAADDATNGRELWKSDGTTAGTILVKDIRPGTFPGTPTPLGSGPGGSENILNLNGTLFFSAADVANGTELWKSDGTTAGTTMVKDITIGGSSLPSGLTAVNGKLFFNTNINGGGGGNLWESDGTAAGTQIMMDSTISFNSGVGGNLTDVNGSLFFTGYTIPNVGIELLRATPPPVITLLGSADVYVEAGSAYVDAGATAVDNIGGNITGGISIGGLASVDVYTVGIYNVTYDVVDSGGKAALQVVRRVHVQDTTVPVITLTGGNVSLEAGTGYVDAGATASDLVDGVLTPNIVIVNPVNANAVAVYTVTYNLSDAAGNAAIQVSRTVTVTADVTPPVITRTGAADVYVEAATTYTDAGATASDSLDGNITGSIVVGGLAAVNTSVIGAYTITYDVSDAATNAAAQVTRVVHVQDTTAPVITMVGSDASLVEGSVYTDAGATATDTLDGSLTSSIVNGGTFTNTNSVGLFTVTYDVSDNASNAATQVVRTITVTAAAGNDPDTPAEPAASSGGGGGGCIAPVSSYAQLMTLLPMFGLLFVGMGVVGRIRKGKVA